MQLVYSCLNVHCKNMPIIYFWFIYFFIVNCQYLLPETNRLTAVHGLNNIAFLSLIFQDINGL